MILCSPSPGTVASEMMTFICELSVFSSVITLQRAHLFPSRIGVNLVGTPISQGGCEDIHEWRPWGNHIMIPCLLLYHSLSVLMYDASVLGLKHFQEFFFIVVFLLSFLCGSEAPRALLVHLRPWRNPIWNHKISPCLFKQASLMLRCTPLGDLEYQQIKQRSRRGA